MLNLLLFLFCPLQAVSITTTSTTTTPTSPLASSSSSQVWSCSWGWASTTACWHERRRGRRGGRGRSQRRSGPPCWLRPLLPKRTRRLSCCMKWPRWTRTRCRNQNSIRTHTPPRNTHGVAIETSSVWTSLKP
ncbi:hypothetical protein EYF80_064348 [Liparis tanakae]|uniref:Secreted protein n=1 Tax=Liparis tanakae TaxID=230148 RepID=A0A4Z2EB79_9TELE|nr:hypothetical protein EYF80_064348 [Liparis tanakae]